MFTEKFKAYAFDGDTIECEVEGFRCTATLHYDDDLTPPDERSDGFWPSEDPKAAGYVGPERFTEEHERAQEVMRAWKNDEWFYGGVEVSVSKAGIILTPAYRFALWGVECNYPGSDNSYLVEVANDLLPEALDYAKAKIEELKTL